MKKHIQNIIITSIVFLFIGFGTAYLIFGLEKSGAVEGEHVMDQMESHQKEEIWTCSMHPQIRQSEPGDCPICGMDLIPVEENRSIHPLALEMTEEAVKLSNIQTTVIGRNSQENTKLVKASGKVLEDERRVSSQVSHVSGRIEKLYVNFTGQKIVRGQKVAEIYSPELISAQRELIEAKSMQELNPGLLEAARKKLQFWKIEPEIIENIEKNEQIMEIFPIRADHKGILSKRRVSVGDYISRGESLFDVADLDRVWVLFDIYEEEIPFVQLGDQISFTTPALPSSDFKGNVSFIDPIVDPLKRTVSVRLEINNSRGKLKPEMLVYGTLQHKISKNNGLRVPKSSVLWTGTRSVVYVKLKDMDMPTFEFREIELGESLGDTYQVMQGIEEGDEVVTYGSFVIDAAAQLNNQTSMMNRKISDVGEGVGPAIPDFSGKVPLTFKEQLSELTSNYLLLKDALVASNASLASQKAAGMLEKLERVDMTLIKGTAHELWMEQMRAIDTHARKISQLGDVEDQRKQFDFLSQAMIEALMSFGIPSDSLYVMHCPMAFGKTGADWISNKKQIRNPYFGDVMLKCGSITDTISISN